MSLGFIGTGVMGEPMCRNLAAKSARPVLACDVAPGPLARRVIAARAAGGASPRAESLRREPQEARGLAPHLVLRERRAAQQAVNLIC